VLVYWDNYDGWIVVKMVDLLSRYQPSTIDGSGIGISRRGNGLRPGNGKNWSKEAMKFYHKLVEKIRQQRADGALEGVDSELLKIFQGDTCRHGSGNTLEEDQFEAINELTEEDFASRTAVHGMDY